MRDRGVAWGDVVRDRGRDDDAAIGVVDLSAFRAMLFCRDGTGGGSSALARGDRPRSGVDGTLAVPEEISLNSQCYQ